MKLNLIITLISLFLLSVNNAPAYTFLPDSTTKIINGKTYLIHKVEPKEGWMSIARRYNITMAEVKEANPGVEALKIGHLINIPTAKNNIIKVEEKQIQETNTANTVKFTEPEQNEPVEIPPVKEKYKTPVKHKVASGETLFSISKKFNVKMEDIRSWNDMDDNSLQLGQDLIVGFVFQYKNENNQTDAVLIGENDIYASAGEVKKTRKEIRREKKEARNREEEIATKDPDAPEINIAEIKYEEARKENTLNKESVGGNTVGVTTVGATTVGATTATPKNKSGIEAGKKAVPVTEKGSASWIDDNDINPSKFYALHRTAPAGTIIKVTNRMNNKTVFVKVVGVLPNTGDNSNLTIKLSKAAANKLDVIDARFQAELYYTIYE